MGIQDIRGNLIVNNTSRFDNTNLERTIRLDNYVAWFEILKTQVQN